MNFKIILLLWVILFAYAQVPGRLEGEYFPVLSNIAVFLEEDGDGDLRTSSIFLNYDKNRNECSYRETKFYLYNASGYDTQFALMDTQYMGYEEVRFSGRYEDVGPWFVRASIEDLKNMTVVMRHRCHIYYETITRIRVRDGNVTTLTSYQY